MCVRYIDKYRKEEDGRWRLASWVVTYDLRSRRAAHESNGDPVPHDPTYTALTSRLFARGSRT